MALTLPGTYVIYNDHGSTQPPAPAIVFPDDAAPHHIQSNRPTGFVYVTLVLLLEEPPRFQWATTPQLLPLLLEGDAKHATYTAGQKQASQTANFLRDAGLGLEHWKSEVREQEVFPEPSFDLGVLSEDMVDSEGENHEELKEALRISRQDFYSTGPSVLPTPSSSPPGQSQSCRNIITIEDEGEYDNDHKGLYSRPPRPKTHSGPKRFRPSRTPRSVEVIQRSRKRSRSASTTNEDDDTSIVTPKGTIRSQFSGASIDQLLGSSILNRRSSAPVSDAIEGDISKSKNFIRVVVGPNGEVRNFQKEHVWDRPYFRDSRTGTNRFELGEDNIWELRHPELATIDVEDFQFVAEFLTDDDFGVRIPDTPEQNKEAIAQCVTAWEAGEKLGMDDLLEHIAEKVQYLEWDKEDVLTLAIMVYRTLGPALPAHTTMREYLSSLMAHHFWSYVKDDVVGPYFRKRLRRLPEMERDVLEKRAEILRKGEEPDEDEESDEDMLGDGDDL